MPTEKMLPLIEGDLTCDADLRNALEGCDFCFHLVSTVLPKSSNLDPLFDIETNLMGTVKLLNHAVKPRLKNYFSFFWRNGVWPTGLFAIDEITH